ncbi:MAG: type II toxin-antitoxin system HicA family toxin [Terriglobia bacterium]
MSWDPSHGKGSHGRLRLGDKSTTLKDLRKEVGKGLLNEMCKQLGVTAEEVNNA